MRSLIFKITVLLSVSYLYILPITEGANWNDFQRKHLIGPTLGPSMNRAQWNTWLLQSLAPERQPNQQYGTKTINTVIADTPTAILNNFQSSTFRHNSATNFFWTSTPVHTYDLRLSHGSYNVFNCGMKHILAGIVSNAPVHLHRHFSTRPSTGNVQSNTQGCVQVH